MAVEQTWALQNTTINAVTFRQMLQALTGTGGGVIPGTVPASISNSKPIDLLVAQQSTPNMTVQVNPGQAVMAGTQLSAPSASYNWTPQGSYYALNDAATSVTIATADPVNPRIDVVYIAAQDSFYSGSNNQSLIGVITGTAAPSPSAPAAPVNSIVLAQVNVAANATSIVTANLVDKRPFNTPPGANLSKASSAPILMNLDLTGTAWKGSTWDGVSPLIYHSKSYVVTASAGNWSVTYPSAFPNGIINVHATVGDNAASLGILQLVISSCTLSTLVGTAFTTSGAAISGAIRFNVTAVGW